MINWMEQGLPKEVMALLTNVMHDNSEVEDLSLACLRYEDNSVAEVVSSVVHHGEEQGIVLQCADAKISAPWSVRAQVSRSNGFPEENTKLQEQLEAYYESIPDLKYEGHTGEIDDVLTALENGTRPLITGEDGRRTIELITAIYKAGCKKETVQLPIPPEDDFYSFDGILHNAVHFYEKGQSVENFEETDITLGNYQ